MAHEKENVTFYLYRQLTSTPRKLLLISSYFNCLCCARNVILFIAQKTWYFYCTRKHDIFFTQKTWYFLLHKGTWCFYYTKEHAIVYCTKQDDIFIAQRNMDKVGQWFTAGRWFSPDTPISSTNKIDWHYSCNILESGINHHSHNHILLHKGTWYFYCTKRSFVLCPKVEHLLCPAKRLER